MVFSSLIFLYAFLPASLICYAVSGNLQVKNFSLLVFSLLFYAWSEPRYLLLLMLMTAVDWISALELEGAEEPRQRRAWLIFAVSLDLALLGIFKYSRLVCSLFGTVPEAVARSPLPIGISFYTFQLLTYVADVYRREARAERRYWHVLLYAALFHQCVAGPIVRYNSIAPELFEHRDGGAELSEGVRRFCLGLGKKVLLANPCGALAEGLLLTDGVLSDPGQFLTSLGRLREVTALGAWLGMGAYMLQIYLDFSAYSDMAIGMGKMLGLHYPENFRHPYAAGSATEFWRRWHISLSSFFRDYVYIPLGGSRRSAARNTLNLLLVWALTGLWHGGSWNFLLWGLYWFVLLALERVLFRDRGERKGLLSHIYLLLAVFFGWILFRFTDLRLGWTVFRGLFGQNGNALWDLRSLTMLENNLFLLLTAALACTPLPGRLSRRLGRFRGWEVCRKALIPPALLLLSTCALVGESYNPFLYFRF